MLGCPGPRCRVPLLRHADPLCPEAELSNSQRLERTENILAPTQSCHVVTDHKPKPLPPCCLTFGTYVFCFYFIGCLVELKKVVWSPFIHWGKASGHLSPHHLQGVPNAGRALPHYQICPDNWEFHQITNSPLWVEDLLNVCNCSGLSQGGSSL